MKSACIGVALFPHPPIMLPEIGKDELTKMDSTVKAVTAAAEKLMEQHPDTIVLMTPHNYVFQDGAGIIMEPRIYGNLSNFGFPELSMQVNTDMDLAEAIVRESKDFIKLHMLTKEWCEKYGYDIHLDQGALVPLYYLHQAGFTGHVVLLSPCFSNYNDMEMLGSFVERAATICNRRIAVVASGDLSHRLLPGSPNGYTPEGAVFDKTVMKALKEQNDNLLRDMSATLIDHAGMCGLPSVYFLFGILRGMNHPVMPVYSYEGPFGVGYGVALYLNKDSGQSAVTPTSTTPDIRVQLARKSILYYLDNHFFLAIPDELPEELFDKAGVFVSLKKHGALRGCIGTFLPMQLSMASEIIHNAVSAAMRDPRFPAVRKEEMEDIEISVDVLGEPEAIDSPDKLDPKKYGVIVMSHAQTGLLLPDLEGVDTVEQQIDIAKQKAGIPPQVKPDLYRFTVTRYK